MEIWLFANALIMIKRINYNLKFKTESVVKMIDESKGIDFLSYKFEDDNHTFTYDMTSSTKIFGLGENIRGINKRGFIYKSFNTDDPNISESRVSLYASHNFIIIKDENNMFGAFFDTPSIITYDLGFSDIDKIIIKTPYGLDLYLITGDTILDIIKEFRELIGESYIAPFWAFGLSQSRWGYKTKDDIINIVENYKKYNLPLDSICMDIDTMDDYQDFTLNSTFTNSKEFIEKLKNDDHVRLVPIVDAAIKAKKGYSVYDEMIEGKHYMADKDGNPYIVGVWPGDSLLPDYLNKEHSRWFGSKYKALLDLGIEGFWNDMNEPVLMYSKNHIDEVYRYIGNQVGKTMSLIDYCYNRSLIDGLQNNINDYKEFYHDIDGVKVSQYDVHNMYGYKMVESASSYFKKYNKDKRYLLYSRSSFIGSHRYSGIWTGDNASWWSHILLIFKMLPSLNMCGYLYCGADTGGFGENTTEDLLIRWTELSIFMPLFRNHNTNGTRAQEYYKFKNIDLIRNLLNLRYALLPYIYSEYIKAIKENKLLFTPLEFIYSSDERCADIEDELIFGDSIILAPIYTQNAKGRMVYLPEDMLMVRFNSYNDYKIESITKGDHYIVMPIGTVTIFIRKGYVVPILNKTIINTSEVDFNDITFIKNNNELTKYTLVLPNENDEYKVIEVDKNE